MLAELFERLLTPCPRHLRRLGCLRELLNIRRRARHWGNAWLPHFERVKGVIRAAIERCDRRDRVIVLGSGWLHDVPLDDLAGAFREVVLVDLLHPFAVRRQARRHGNVRLLSADVTGMLEGVYHAGRSGGPLPEPGPSVLPGGEADLVASVMLLSQLHILPEQYLARMGWHAPDQVARFAQAVIVAHLECLRRLPGTVALVTDVENQVVATTGRPTRRSRLLRGVELPAEDERWDWPLVPPGPTRQGHVRTVVGIVDLKRAGAMPGSGG